MEYGNPIVTKTKNMNRNKSTEELAQEIFNKINPNKPTLLQDLQKNSYKLSTFNSTLPTEDLVLNQAVISDASMTGLVAMPDRPTGVSRPGKVTSIVPYMQLRESSKGIVSYIYESNTTDGAAVRLEGGLIGMGDRTWEEKTVKAVNISEYINITNESLEDPEFVVNEIETGLKSDMELVLSNQLINGNGVAPQMPGMMLNATSFAAGSFAGAVVDPTYNDVLKIAGGQVLKAGYVPDLCICHPDDYTTLSLSMNLASDISFNIIPTTQMTKDNYLVFNTWLAPCYIYGQKLTFSDQNQDNPLHNRTSIIGLMQAMFRMAPNNYDGFVKGQFSVDVAAITAA